MSSTKFEFLILLTQKALYKLLRKKSKFLWRHEQDLAMEELKKILKSPPALKQVEYNSGRPVIVTVDTSPIAIGWAIG